MIIQFSQLAKVSKKLEDGSIIEATGKEEIENICLEENESKFTQTNSTPFMNGQLLQDVGFNGEKEGGEKILQGTYTPPADTTRAAKAYIKELCKPQDLIHTPLPQITTTDFQAGWKQMKERISAGISARISSRISARLNRAEAQL